MTTNQIPKPISQSTKWIVFSHPLMRQFVQDAVQEDIHNTNALANLTAVWGGTIDETISRLRKISDNYGETPASVVWDVVRTGRFDYDENGRVVVYEATAFGSMSDASDAVDELLGLEL